MSLSIYIYTFISTYLCMYGRMCIYIYTMIFPASHVRLQVFALKHLSLLLTCRVCWYVFLKRPVTERIFCDPDSWFWKKTRVQHERKPGFNITYNRCYYIYINTIFRKLILLFNHHQRFISCLTCFSDHKLCLIIIMIFMMISKLWLYMVYGLWWASEPKQQRGSDVQSVDKKKIFKDVCMFNPSQEIWTLQNHRNSQDDNHWPQKQKLPCGHTIQGNQTSFTWFSKTGITAGKWS